MAAPSPRRLRRPRVPRWLQGRAAGVQPRAEGGPLRGGRGPRVRDVREGYRGRSEDHPVALTTEPGTARVSHAAACSKAPLPAVVIRHAAACCCTTVVSGHRPPAAGTSRHPLARGPPFAESSVERLPSRRSSFDSGGSLSLGLIAATTLASHLAGFSLAPLPAPPLAGGPPFAESGGSAFPWG